MFQQIGREANGVDDAKMSDKANVAEWLAYGRTHFEQRFSPLTDIHVGNVSELGVDWFVDLPEATGLAATPLVSDGVMYFVTSRNKVHAVEATTGDSLWEYDPDVAGHSGQRMRASFLHGNRGVALWEDKVIFATVDGRLIALESSTGKKVWSVQTTDPTQALYISGAPKVFKDKVLIGNGGTENGPSRGYVTAYHAHTAAIAGWRLDIILPILESSSRELVRATAYDRCRWRGHLGFVRRSAVEAFWPSCYCIRGAEPLRR